jgi:hypothetical protein
MINFIISVTGRNNVMEMKLKKLWPLFGAMCVSLLAPAFADTYQYSGSTQTSGSTQQTDQGTYQRGTYREITPVAGPRVAHGADVFLTADFIWWKTVQEGTQYAVSGGLKTGSLQAFQNASKGKSVEVGEDWSPGFKVGLGLNLSHDGWDLYAQYTWLNSSNHSSTSHDHGVGLQGFGLGGDGPFVFGNKASANWDHHLNVIDLEMGRNFYLSQFFTMRPFIGLKGTWQDQDKKFKFEGDEFQLDSETGGIDVSGPYHLKEHFDVWGIGVRGGFNIAWYMSKCWSFYGDFAWTTMWANYHDLNRKDHIEDIPTGNDVTVVHLDNDNHYAVKYIGELELGLRWETWFYDDNYHFAIQAGWEEQVWVNWAPYVELLDESWADLSFHGLNLKFRFDF